MRKAFQLSAIVIVRDCPRVSDITRVSGEGQVTMGRGAKRGGETNGSRGGLDKAATGVDKVARSLAHGRRGCCYR